MLAYDWPGNVRELRNFIERSLIMGFYPVDSLPVAGLSEREKEGKPVPDASDIQGDYLEEVEKRHILQILCACEGNKSEAARRLGISRKTLERKCVLWNQGDA
jgi:DNA-binding NtrC family response regulator